MKQRALMVLALPLAVGGCSYSYGLKAVSIGGRLAFIVDPDSNHAPSCFNTVEVIARGDVQAIAAPDDDANRVSYGTFWYQRLAYDCTDEFPLLYGQTLKGKPNPLGQAPDNVSAKSLKISVVYEVSTTSGATGYGGGAFKILPDHRVVNLPLTAMTGSSREVEQGSISES